MHINQIETRDLQLAGHWNSLAWYSPSACSASYEETCTMMHELMLISILTQYLVNYYIFIIYYLQNLADQGWRWERFMNNINELITNKCKITFAYAIYYHLNCTTMQVMLSHPIPPPEATSVAMILSKTSSMTPDTLSFFLLIRRSPTMSIAS